MSKYKLRLMLSCMKWNEVGIRSTVVACWTGIKQVEINPAPGAWFIKKITSLARVVPRTVLRTVQNHVLKHQSFHPEVFLLILPKLLTFFNFSAPYVASYVKESDRCQVCAKPTNGKHYGVFSCEACKVSDVFVTPVLSHSHTPCTYSVQGKIVLKLF